MIWLKNIIVFLTFGACWKQVDFLAGSTGQLSIFFRNLLNKQMGCSSDASRILRIRIQKKL